MNLALRAQLGLQSQIHIFVPVALVSADRSVGQALMKTKQRKNADDPFNPFPFLNAFSAVLKWNVRGEM